MSKQIFIRSIMITVISGLSFIVFFCVTAFLQKHLITSNLLKKINEEESNYIQNNIYLISNYINYCEKIAKKEFKLLTLSVLYYLYEKDPIIHYSEGTKIYPFYTNFDLIQSIYSNLFVEYENVSQLNDTKYLTCIKDGSCILSKRNNDLISKKFSICQNLPSQYEQTECKKNISFVLVRSSVNLLYPIVKFIVSKIPIPINNYNIDKKMFKGLYCITNDSFHFASAYNKMITKEFDVSNIEQYLNETVFQYYLTIFKTIPYLNPNFNISKIINSLQKFSFENPFSYQLNKHKKAVSLIDNETSIAFGGVYLGSATEASLINDTKTLKENMQLIKKYTIAIFLLEYNLNAIESFATLYNIFNNNRTNYLFSLINHDISYFINDTHVDEDLLNQQSSYINVDEFYKYLNKRELFTKATCLKQIKKSLFNTPFVNEDDYSTNKFKDCFIAYNDEITEYINDLDVLENPLIEVNNTYNLIFEIQQKKKKKNSLTTLVKVSKFRYPKIIKKTNLSGKENNNLYSLIIDCMIVQNEGKKLSYKSKIDYVTLNYLYFFLMILFVIWVLVVISIIVIAIYMSRKISKPVDDLINLITKEKMHSNKNDFIKKIQKLEYSDDSDIKELFDICKKMLTGYYLEQVNYGDHKGIINTYNNISLTKTNNMIIDESKVNKAIENEGLKYFVNRSNKKKDKKEEETDINENISNDIFEKKSKGQNKNLRLSEIIKKNKGLFSNLRVQLESSDYYNILEQCESKKKI